MPIVTNVVVLDEQIAATGLAIGLAHRRYVVALRGQARVMTDLLQRTQDRLAGILRAARVLLVGVDAITVRADGPMTCRLQGQRAGGGGPSAVLA